MHQGEVIGVLGGDSDKLRREKKANTQNVRPIASLMSPGYH